MSLYTKRDAAGEVIAEFGWFQLGAVAVGLAFAGVMALLLVG